MEKNEHRLFEDEVRRKARALWPKAGSKGAIKVDGRERDGVFFDGDIFHIVEVTTSNKVKKVNEDLQKSLELVKKIKREYPDKLTKIWIVTKLDPTADQQGLAPRFKKKAKCPIEICGVRAFSAKLIDSAQYLELRKNYPFGSVRNPADDQDINVPPDEYIPLDMLRKGTSESTVPEAALKLILQRNQKNIAIIGDFGSGKSMTLRWFFYALEKKHLSSEIARFPVYLNLRDHLGQSDPAEALIRHANKIGMAEPNQLVAAWRAASIILFLDGFDEISAARLVRGSEKIKQARRQAVRLVHEFIEQSPSESKVIVSGREHYFDSYKELTSALALKTEDLVFTLNEFSQDQIEKFLMNKGIDQHIPDWLPSRPLLLGYLVVRGLLDPTSKLAEPISQEDGWNYILDRVCEREARQIDPVLIEPTTVREFIERLATNARNTVSGRGPVFIREISAIFETIFDRPPDEKAEILILRLPGLTSSSGEDSAREFLDDDFVDACRGGDVVRFVEDPFDPSLQDLKNTDSQMGGLGCRLAAFRLIQINVTAKQISAAVERAGKTLSAFALTIDLMRIMQELNMDYDGDQIFIRDSFFDAFEIFERPDFSRIKFQECYLARIEVDAGAVESTSPRFEKCQIDNLIVPYSKADIPKGIFDHQTNIDAYPQEAQTNADILALDMPLSVRVLLTALRKLFVQPGSGRKENAFYRGLDSNARAYVSDVLESINSYGFAHPHKISGPKVWMPNRANASIAREILKAPTQTKHPLVTKIRNL